MIKQNIKKAIRGARMAKDTSNRNQYAECREIIKMLWRKRHA